MSCLFITLIITSYFSFSESFFLKNTGFSNNIVRSLQLFRTDENTNDLPAKWFPFANVKAPKILDGTLAGDVGFDPLGFSKSKKTLFWMREAEIKHGRLAMLAAIGWPLSELLHKNLAYAFNLDSILASGDRAPSILNGGLTSSYAYSMLITSIIVAGLIEKKITSSPDFYWNNEKSSKYNPGDIGFDPFNLYDSMNGNRKSMETAEIKHGRLAMLAVVSYVAQEALYGTPIIQQTPYLF